MRILAFIGVLALIALAGAGVFLFSGLFDIGAGWEDPTLVKAAIVRIREASIARHATDTPPANFDETGRAQAGARVFATLGCANCHGAPGVKWQKFSEGLNPDPPDLKEVTPTLSPAQLFWVVKNGIRMTGMPGFGASGASDADFWSLVAFLKKLPQATDADYKAWTVIPASGGPPKP